MHYYSCTLFSCLLSFPVQTFVALFVFLATTSYVSISALLEISPVERGVVTLFGLRSGLFVAMSITGKLYGSVRSDQD